MHPADRERRKRPVSCAEQIRASASQSCRLSKPSLVECLLVASIDLGTTANVANGHEKRFPPPSLSAGYGFRKETIAGMRR